MTGRIVIDLFDGAEELDAIGPWEVLSWWTLNHPEDGWRVDLVTDDGLPRRCAKGLQLTPTAATSEVPLPDLVIEPGGQGTRARLADTAHLQRLHDAARRGALVTSVCTGALVLAAAGLLQGRPAITHHTAFDELLGLEPTITLRRDQRWVDDGPVVTAAGVSAGIDMALHLVGRLAGADRARQVQDEIEYHPSTRRPLMAQTRPPVPPFTAESAARKVQAAEDAWNTCDPARVAQAYTVDTVWRNRDRTLTGRDEVIAFLTDKWDRELDYRLRKNLWAYTDDQIAVRFQYEWRDREGQWWRSYGNELWHFDADGYMTRREASINDRPVFADERRVVPGQGILPTW